MPGNSSSNPLRSVRPDILARLKHLDVSKRLSFDPNRVASCGSYSDVLRGDCEIAVQGHVKVGVKRMRFHLQEDIKNLFEKEIYVWAKLRHNNVLPLLGFAFDPSTGYPLLVSEWMEHGSALRYIISHPKCNLTKFIFGIAEGLAYLHEQGVIHSDLKPDNILVSSVGHPVICDFGCARMIAASRSLAIVTGGQLGTIHYLAYELLALLDSYKSHSLKSDVWAFGMTVYELLTLCRPYHEQLHTQVAMAIVQGRLPELPSHIKHLVDNGDEVKGFLWKICLACWEHDPKERSDMKTIVTMFRGSSVLQLSDKSKFSLDSLNSECPSSEYLQVLDITSDTSQASLLGQDRGLEKKRDVLVNLKNGEAVLSIEDRPVTCFSPVLSRKSTTSRLSIPGSTLLSRRGTAQRDNEARLEYHSGSQRKILILGQAQSGKTTAWKLFRFIHSRQKWESERSKWRPVVHLNLLRHVNTVLVALSQETGGVTSHYDLINEEHQRLRTNLSLLQGIKIELEQVLKKFTLDGPFCELTEVDSGQGPKILVSSPISYNQDRSKYSSTLWKSAVGRIRRGSKDSGSSSESLERKKFLETGTAIEGRDTIIDLSVHQDTLLALWSDPIVRQLLSRRKILDKGAEFFLESIRRITAPAYIPTNEDILNSYLSTNDLQEQHLSTKNTIGSDQDWLMYDVGLDITQAQYLFNDVHVIIFLVSVDRLEKYMNESSDIGCLDVYNLWRSICDNRLLIQTQFVLFLNKYDVLRRKVEGEVSTERLSDTLKSITNGICDEFRGIAKRNTSRYQPVYIHLTTLTDIQSSSVMLSEVCENVLSNNITRTSDMLL